MKLKTLRKKVRRLETRLREGPKKLEKLKRKLAEMEAAKERARKSAARSPAARQMGKSLKPIAKKTSAKATKKRAPVKKAKRKLNLSPERRAQLATAMKARWAAKRAAAETKPPESSVGGDFTLGQAPQSP